MERLFLVLVGDVAMGTYALPTVGSVTIGRSPECDVRIDDASISRAHAVLHFSPTLRIVDSGSANGTWLGERRLAANIASELQIDASFRLGTVTAIVQRRAARAQARTLHTHAYFEERLEEECARGLRRAWPFALIHVIDQSGVLEAALDEVTMGDEVVAVYAPGELEMLVVGAGPEEVAVVVERIEAVAAARGLDVRIAAAIHPRDGRDASALAARARSRLLADYSEEPQQPDVVVVDERMAALHQLVVRVAQADITVLLQGETGVGKEVIAESIHRNSPRASKPCVKLNCASFTETLLESELFGHEKGAFTGAVAAKPGLLELADGGVLFLDEVGELSPNTQAKLLRVLDERILMRVGSVVPRSIDVRIVSATNRDLEAEVMNGSFRRDLLYRLNAMSIIIPPLRERPTEILPLARRFLEELARRNDRPVARLTEAAIAMLRAYAWPGNVRELRNAIERATVVCTNNVIDIGDLPVEKMRDARVVSRTPDATPRVPVFASARGSEVAAEERRQILEALEACGGNQTNAAKLLGIARRTLINKLEKFAVPRPRKR